MKFVILLYLVVFAKAEHEVSYKNYKLYEIFPLTEEHIQFLQNLEETQENFMFWKHPGYVNNSVDLMVPPDQDEYFLKMMHTNSLQYKLIFQDVQKSLDEDERCESKKPFHWKKYQSWSKITFWLQGLKKEFPDKIKIICIGRTYEGRNIVGVRLSFNKIRKPAVFIEGGMHGREKISPATVTYILHRFLTSSNLDVISLAEKYDWYFFPVVNPDGYIYNSGNKLWRKTRSKNNLKCRGADPNRNFGYRWAQYDGSTKSCSQEFSGPSPFSEIETRSLARFVKLISHRLFAYISFHSYGKLLTFPYGHSTKHLDNYYELLAIGRKAIAALRKRRGTRFQTGNVASILRRITATSTDWVKAALKMPIVFTYILDDTKKFALPSKEIIPIGKEVVDSFVALFKAAEKLGYPKS